MINYDKIFQYHTFVNQTLLQFGKSLSRMVDVDHVGRCVVPSLVLKANEPMTPRAVEEGGNVLGVIGTHLSKIDKKPAKKRQHAASTPLESFSQVNTAASTTKETGSGGKPLQKKASKKRKMEAGFVSGSVSGSDSPLSFAVESENTCSLGADKKHSQKIQLGDQDISAEESDNAKQEKTSSIKVAMCERIIMEKGDGWRAEVANYSKKQACLFCSALCSKIGRHLQDIHGAEPEVAEFVILPKRSKEKQKKITIMRNRGNYQHNMSVIENGQGSLITVKRPTTEMLHHQFYPCPSCVGFYHRHELSRHVRMCEFRSKSFTEDAEGVLAESRVLLNSDNIKESRWSKLASKMSSDELFSIMSEDPVFHTFAIYLLEKHAEINQINICQRLRQLAHFVLIHGKVSGLSLIDLVKPESFDMIISSVKTLCSHSLQLSIGVSLRKVASLLIGQTLCNQSSSGNIELRERTECFLTMFDSEWSQQLKNQKNMIEADEDKKEEEVKVVPKPNKPRLSITERDSIYDHFKELISQRNIPGKKQCMSYLTETKSSHDWQRIKSVVSSRVCRELARTTLSTSVVSDPVGGSIMEPINKISISSALQGEQGISAPYESTETVNEVAISESSQENQHDQQDVEESVSTFTDKSAHDKQETTPTVKVDICERIIEEKEDGSKIEVPNYSKRQACFFCGVLVSKIGRHLEEVHHDESEVVEFAAMPKKSKEKLRKIAFLRNRGNYKHNLFVLKNGLGSLITVKRPSAETSHHEYYPCTSCTGFYHKNELWRHVRACDSTSLISKGNIIVESRALLTNDISAPNGEHEASNSTSPTDAVNKAAKAKHSQENQQEHQDDKQVSCTPTEYLDHAEQSKKISNIKVGMCERIIEEKVDGSKTEVANYCKKQACFFCGSLVSKICRHLEEVHRKEPEIIEFAEMTKQSTKKMHKITLLRNRGNYKHNMFVINSGRGGLITVKRPTTKMSYHHFQPCPSCFGFYHKHDLWRHFRSCDFRCSKTLEDNEDMLAESRVLLIKDNIRDGRFSKLMSKMGSDGVFEIMSDDAMIRTFGIYLLEKHTDDHHDYIWQRLQQLSHFVLHLQRASENESLSLTDLVNPESFDLIIASVQTLYSNSRQLKLGASLRKVASLLIGQTLCDQSTITSIGLRKSAMAFITIFDSDWSNRIGIQKNMLEVEEEYDYDEEPQNAKKPRLSYNERSEICFNFKQLIARRKVPGKAQCTYYLTAANSNLDWHQVKGVVSSKIQKEKVKDKMYGIPIDKESVTKKKGKTESKDEQAGNEMNEGI
jgi:hypothetical protein